MCKYTATLHLLCGCTTFALPSPNLCRASVRNSTPCTYNSTSHLLSHRSNGIETTSTVHRFKSSILHSTINSEPLLPFRSFSKDKPEDRADGVVSSLTLCGFCDEDKREVEFNRSGKEKWGLGGKLVGERKRKRGMKKMMRELRVADGGERRVKKRRVEVEYWEQKAFRAVGGGRKDMRGKTRWGVEKRKNEVGLRRLDWTRGGATMVVKNNAGARGGSGGMGQSKVRPKPLNWATGAVEARSMEKAVVRGRGYVVGGEDVEMKEWGFQRE